jgi:hypothetical protein
VLLRCGEETDRLPEAIAAAALVGISPYVWACQGSGPVVALAALLCSAALSPRHSLVAGVLAGLAIWARPDAGIAVAILSVLTWRSTDGERRSVKPFVAAAAVTTVVGVLGAWLAFGTLTPNTVAAKRDFAALASQFFTTGEFWRRFQDLLTRATGSPAWVFALPGLAGLGLLLRQTSIPLRLVALHGLAAAVFYTALDLPFFAWYLLPLLISLVVGWCFSIGALVRLTRRPRRRAVAAAVLLLGGWIAARAAWTSANWLRDGGAGDWKAWAYSAAADWIRVHSIPEHDVVFDEVGRLAYFSDRPVRDLVGLVSPENRPFAAVGDPLGAFLKHPTEFVPHHTFDPRGGTGPIVHRPWFAAAYTEVARLEHPSFDGAITIYRRMNPAAIPPPRPPVPRP